ncbi:MAG: HlyD family efflux transporter periplasmic adaptor subunit [Imperialibacter sp.]|uniref:efflux RND transporter periplasmic adaptor subunit n=1 Tax=Imperialibacter sp. TaxID=2038411 RepID=UPI0032EC5BC1
MKKRYILPASILVILIALLLFSQRQTDDGRNILVDVGKGKFVVDVTTTGELSALNSVRVLGPSHAQNNRIYNLKIERIVDEGTVVKKGEFVASIDKSEVHTKLSDAGTNLEKAQSQFDQAKLDSAITLRTEREKIINLQYVLQEKELILEQSQFEPPATVKQNEIAVQKAKRELDQTTENYQLKIEQSVAKMQEVGATLKKEKSDYRSLQELLTEFTILAPQDGMVIYYSDWSGNKRVAGSQFGPWDPVVATLPDLTQMISVTFINEVDIRKVKPGQKVKVGLDAYPDKRLTGEVIKVANVGQQNPNSDAKVFEVTVRVNESDPSLRPAMTTSNNIVVQELDSAVFVPLEAIHSRNDSIQYVVLADGSNQEIEMGITNSNEAVVLQGLTGNEKVYLSLPEGTSESKINMLSSLNGKRNKERNQEVAEVSQATSEVRSPRKPD